jgi:hypothetical protein
MPGDNRSGHWCKTFAGVGLVLISAWLARGEPTKFSFDATGNLLLRVPESVTAPEILGSPQRQIAAPGGLASFFVVAANTRDLAYQWRFNGTNIAGATNDTLLLTNIGAPNEGQYSVVLVNSSGSLTSAPALLMLDGDGDGLPDSWELAHFGNLNQTSTGDFDGDGVSNRDEFLDGTNPANNASVLFRLTVLSDGGQVTVNPSRFSFTNGEIVTLTATAFPPNTVHGWTGDTNTTSPIINLVMTTNMTVFAHVGTYDMTWTNNAGGDWNVRSNWQPNLVPGTNDRVVISMNATVTLNSTAACGNLVLGSASTSPTLTGSGALTLHKDSSWLSGLMSGSGRTIIPAGVTLSLAGAGAVTLTTRTLENGGTVLWTGGDIRMTSAVLTNLAGALVENRGAGGLAYNGGTSRFDNAGTFRKSINAGTNSIGGSIAFNNYGTVEIQTGTLLLDGGGLNHGTMAFPAGTTLDLSGGTFTGSASSSITGAGQFRCSGGTANLAGLVNLSGPHTINGGTANLTGNFICTNNTLTIPDGTANFSGTGLVTPAVLNLSGGTFTVGTLGGSQAVTVLGVMNWTAGVMSGIGRTIIPAGATLNLANGSEVNLTTRTLENAGTMLWTGGNIRMASAVITNRTGALVENRGAGGLVFNGGSSRFDNAGTFRKTISTGTNSIGSNIAFNNYSTVEIRSGTLAANGGYNSTASSLLSCALAGTTPSTGYGRLQVAGTVALNGALSVVLTNGFVPTTNDAFTVLTAGTRSTPFASFYYPSNQVTMQLSNTTSSVIVRVTAVAVPPPLLLSPVLADTNVLLTWTAVSNAVYRLEFNPSVDSTDWTALAGDVTALSNTASKLDPLTPSNRFYRVRVIP